MLNYKSTEAANYFANNRINLKDFYPTEIDVLSRLIKYIKKRNLPFNIVDLGCGAGGLGNTLIENDKTLINYTGIDINENSIAHGNHKFPDLNLIQSDIIDYFGSAIHKEEEKNIDIYISLSCIDWNTGFTTSIKLINEACIRNNTDFLFTFRASSAGSDNIDNSYQFVNYEGKCEGEVAGYVVLSYAQINNIIGFFKPKKIIISTYTGPPSKTAMTPYKKLIFGCMWFINDLEDDTIFNDMKFQNIQINGDIIQVHGNFDPKLFFQ